MADKIDLLFDDLQARGFAKDKTRDDFRKYMLAPGEQGYKNRKTFFEDFKSQGMTDLNTYEDFRDLMGLHAANTATNKPANAPFSPQQVMSDVQQTLRENQRVINRIGNLQQRVGLYTGPRVQIGGTGWQLGQNRKVTQGQQRFNPSTGQMEQTYITTSGNEYGRRELADLEENTRDQIEYDTTHPVEGLSARINSQIRELESRRQSIMQSGMEQARQDLENKGGFRGAIDRFLAGKRDVGPFGPTRAYAEQAARNKELATIETALKDLRDAQTRIERGKQLSASSDFLGGIGVPFTKDWFNNWKNFGYGIWDTMDDVAFNFFGNRDIDKANAYLRIKDKIESGKELTDTETNLALAGMAKAQAEELVSLPHGYTAGETTLEMAPFMFQMAANPAGGMSRSLARQAVRQFGRNGLKAVTTRVLARGLGNLGEAAILSNTLQGGKTAADIAMRYSGDSFQLDDNGKLHMGYYEEGPDGKATFVDGGKSLLRSVYEGEASSIIENFTELGFGGNIGKAFGGLFSKAAASKLGSKIGLEYISGLVSKIGSTPFAKSMKSFMERTHWDGMIEEPLEEEYGIILNSFLGTGDAKISDLWDSEKQADIFAGTMWFGGFMAGMNTAAYPIYRHGIKKQLQQADQNGQIAFGDEWEVMKNGIDMMDDKEVAKYLYSIKDNDAFSKEQRAALFAYTARLKQYQGAEVADMLSRMEGNLSDDKTAIITSYDAGYDTEEPDDMKIIVDGAEAARQQLQQYGNEFSIMIINGADNPGNTLDYLMEHRDIFSDEQIAAAGDYYQKQAMAIGVMDGQSDKVDLEVERANAEVRSNTHQQSGNVVMATVNDEDVYVIGGEIVTDPNTGMTAVTGTGGAVVVKNPVTGQVSVKSPQEVVIQSVQNADELIQQNETALREQLVQQADDNISFGSPANEVFDMEDLVSFQDGNGNVVNGMVVQLPNAVDGTYVIQTVDNKVLQMTADDLNRRIVAHNGMQVERASARPVTQPAAEGAAQPTEQQGGNLNNAAGEASAEDGTGADNPPASAISRIPVATDEKGQPILKKGRPQYLWHQVSVEDAAAALIELAGGDKLMARDTATDSINAARERLEKIRKQKAKGEDAIEIIESRKAIKQQEAETQAIIKQWQKVNQLIQNMMQEESAARQAAIEAAKSEEQRQREAEEARILKEKQREIEDKRLREQIEKDRERRNKEYEPLVQARKEMADDAEALAILENIEPRSLEEFVSSLLRPHSMLWQDASDSEIGLQTELGLNRSDMQRMMSLLGTKESGAKPFGQVVLDIHEGMPEGMKNMYTDADVRNVLLDLFNEGSSTRMLHLTEEHRIEEARNVYAENQRREAEAEMEAWAEAYHLTSEERETFEDFMQQPPSLPEQDIINQIIAENEQSRTSPAVGEQPVSGTDAGSLEGGEGQVRQTAEAAGNGDNAEAVNQGAEAQTGQQAVADNNVSGTARDREALAVLFDQIGADPILAERMSDFDVEQLTALVEDWEIANDAYGQVIEQTKDILSRKRKPAKIKDKEYDDAKAKVDEAQAAANEMFEPIAMYVEGLNTKYGIESEEPFEGAIPTPVIDKPRYDVNRQALIDAYKSGDPAAITQAAQAIQQYVDEGLDAGEDKTEMFDIAEDYDGNDPEKLADQYIIRTFWDRYLDDDADKEYIKTGLKPSMRKIAPSEQLKPTDLRDAVIPKSAELGVNEAIARAKANIKSRPIMIINSSADIEALANAGLGQEFVDALVEDYNDEKVFGRYIPETGEIYLYLDHIAKANVGVNIVLGTIYHENVHSLSDGRFTKEEFARTAELIGTVNKKLYDWVQQNHKEYVKEVRDEEVVSYFIDDIVRNGDDEALLNDELDFENDELNNLVSKIVKLLRNEKEKVPAIDGRATEGTDGRRAYPSADLETEGYPEEAQRLESVRQEPGQNNEDGRGITSSPSEISAEEAKVDTNPTEAQKEAGNYQKGHIKVDGFDVTIENPKGSIRRGTDASGKQWEQEMHNTYGYILGTEGVDGDHIDVFLSDNPASGKVWVVDQVNKDGSFDEHKVMYGFANVADATKAYLSNYEEGWQGLGSISGISREEFKKWIESSHRKTKPFRDYALAKSAEAKEKKSASKPAKEHKRIVSDEKMEDLRKQLLAKFNNMNEGIDVERMLLGAMYAVGKIERGVTKFADYAAQMVDEIGDAIRPYLKAFYNAVRDMPEAAPYRDQMDSAEYVDKFDVYNFDKKQQPTAIEKAEQVVKQQKAKKQVKKIIQEQPTLWDNMFAEEQPKRNTPWWNDPNRPQSLDPSDYHTYTTDEAKAYFAQFKSEDGKTDFTKWAHPNLAYITAAAWDGANIPVEELMEIAEIQEAESRVKEKKLNKEKFPTFRISKQERRELAARLLDDEHGSAVFENGKIKKVNDKEVFTGPVRQEKKAFVVVGRPAGGKSSVFANRLSHDNGARIVDSDVVKPWLSGYDEGYGAGYVQNASADVASSALKIASDAGDNIVLPRIGGDGVMNEVIMLREKGYDVQIFYNEVSEETSIMRAASRFAQEGRYLSLDYLTQIKDKDSKSFRTFVGEKIGDYYEQVQSERTRPSDESVSSSDVLAGRGSQSGNQDKDLRRGDFGRGRGADVPGMVPETGRPERAGQERPAGAFEEEPIFSYAEWKSNDVAFGEKPKEIWNSKSGKPMPTKKGVNDDARDLQQVGEENRRGHDGLSSRESSVSRSADNNGLDSDLQERRNERQGDTGVSQSVGSISSSTAGQLRPVQELTQQQPAQPKQAPKHNNKRNNSGERGKDYAPTSPKARFNANVEAIKMMRELIDQGIEAPTKDQMEVLRQYSGWGGLGIYFNDETSAENKILRDLLDDEEYNDAVMSINSAYYTPATVIDALWDVAKAMGFKGGNVLEGSAGIGNIIGQMPKDMSRQSDIEAVEIDKISGNILKLLYPDAKVHIQGFQDTVIRNGSVDLAVTNVPFVTGLHVIDKVDKDLSRRFVNIHDFCIAKNIRKLREGGIGIFITSSGTLDKSTDLRAWITDEGQADVVGAFRLNNETFGGTKVTSDIIVVRKRIGGVKSPAAIDVSQANPVRVGTYEDKFHNEHQVTMVINDYFKEHPEMMAGEMAFGYEKGDTFRPGSYGLYPVRDKSMEQEDLLQGWVRKMQQVGKEMPQTSVNKGVVTEVEPNQLTAVKEGRMLIDESGRICVSRYGEAVPLGLNDQKVKGQTKQQCFKDYQAVQAAVDDVLQQQLNDPDDEALKPKLAALNKAYDLFTKRYGTLHKNTAISFLRNDIDFPSFQALEIYKEEKDIKGNVKVTTAKPKLFSERVIGFKTEPQPKTVKDAVIASIFRTNGIDLEWIATKLNEVAAPPNGDNWTTEDVRKGILVSRLAFEDPSTGQLEIRYKYLSGNVREKLAIAEQYNAEGETAGRYAANVEELKKVVPMDIPAHLIDFSLGSSWIPQELYHQYLEEVYDLKNVRLSHIEGSWMLEPQYMARNEKNRAAGVYSEKFRETIYGHQLVAAAMNNRPVKVAKQVSEGYGSSKTTHTEVDQAATQACAVRVDEIKDEFKTWAKKKMQEDSELARRIEKLYNDKFNALVPMQVGDEFLPEIFDGANQTLPLYVHQKRGVMRGITAPTMLAHEVGTGKSFTLITTAMEMRRLGTAKKPMIVVQNATVAQMTADTKLLYPNAKVLSLSEQDRDAEGRRAFYAKIRYNDWDCIIVPQSTFERIPDSPERELQFIQEKIDEKKHVIEAAQAAGVDSRDLQKLQRELEKIEQEYGDAYLDRDPANNGGKKKKRDAKREAASLDKAETRAKEQLDRAVDDVQYFDDLGVDALLVDEAHEYKHLGFQTSIGRGIKGIDPSYSKKCAGLYNKTRSVFEKAGWKNVVFATGTPISNTAAEIWTFMKYLMPADVMKANDIYYFDDFVHNFGSISQMLEFSTSGKFKENTRFAAYVNKPELIRIWSQVTDTVLTKEVAKVQEKIPEQEGGKDQDVFLPQSPSLIRIMAAVRAELERFENMSGQEKKENSSIPLTMYGVAKRAAIDPRLVDAEAPDEPLSKTNAAVAEIVKDLKATKDYKGTVAVFCDNQNRLGTNAAGKKVVDFNIYEDMKAKLIKAGVPEKQIAIIKSGMSITAKQKIFDAVNSGDIRVVLGSTQTLGTGVNMQERLHLLIHMDAPDRPMDYTQRNGRIKRQGNLHKNWGKTIRVIRFGVEDSLDVTAYQRLKTKSGFIDSIMDGKAALANNQVDRTVEEEEEGLFDNPVAVLSGSQYALKKNQAERELRKYQGKKAQWEADQIYVTNQLRHNANQLQANEANIKTEQQQLERIKGMFPDGTVKTITVEGVKIDMTKDDGAKKLGDAIKEKINDPVNAIVKRNRENAIYNDETLKYTISLDGHDVKFTVQVVRESVWDNGRMKTVIHKFTSYSWPELNMDSMESARGVRDYLDEILDQIVTGRDSQDRIDAMQQANVRIQAENEQLQQRVGMPFQFDKELEEAEKNVEEYTELMKKEMQEKEAKYAAQQKEAEADGKGFNLSKAEDTEDDDLYSMEGAWDEPVFYSNAERAVESIRQEKATPEQWLAMIQKAGGIKAGEDKWLGLSDWLINNEKRTLTKQEVLGFIMANQIEVQEEHYQEQEEMDSILDGIYEMEGLEFRDEFADAFEIYDGDLTIRDEEAAIRLYNRENVYQSPLDWDGYVIDEDTEDTLLEWAQDVVDRANTRTKEINQTRLKFTTAGLENKREIALTVPGIQPYRQDDDIHFGDAGGGRSVAWVRFGEISMNDAGAVYDNHDSFILAMQRKYGAEGPALRKKLTDEEKRQEDELLAGVKPNTPKTRVLVIDEIQSKRHQDGRDKGYIRKSNYVTENEVEKSIKDYIEYCMANGDSLNTAIGYAYNQITDAPEESKGWTHSAVEKVGNAMIEEGLGSVPDAPFDKNWYELAMKRMLRYAAENGYDKIAWTTGAQQAERYNIGNVANSVLASDWQDFSNFAENAKDCKMISIYNNDNAIVEAIVNREGKIVKSPNTGLVDKSLAEVVGKEMAIKLLSDGLQKLEGEQLRIGAEGMKGFYDEMLVRFMNKYGKKWGVQVSQTELPGINKTMWSIDVTPEMKSSVMLGQPMFRDADVFTEGESFPINTTLGYSSFNVLGTSATYSTDLMPDAYTSHEEMLDAIRRQYPAYYARIEDGQVVMESWQHVFGAADAARQRKDKGSKSYVERKTRNAINAVQSLAKQMHLDVEVLTTTDGLEGKKARAKGWFNRKTGKITLVLPNHSNQSDLINTLLHEGVAHYGLRNMFGQHFDTFLDNVYNNVSPEIKARIDAAMKRNKWSRHEATEEYLARLAEQTDFNHATRQGWWQKIKEFFMNMLANVGLVMDEPLTDNELRYILWRSYDNLLHPDSRRNIFDKAREVQIQSRLRVGPYSERERQRIQRTGRIDTSRIVAEKNVPMYAEADVLIDDVQNSNVKTVEQGLSIGERVRELPQSQLVYAYTKVNGMMLDEDGLNVDEHNEKVKSDWIKKHGLEGVGKAMADDLKALMDKYGEGMLTLRWELLDRIENLGIPYEAGRTASEGDRVNEEMLNPDFEGKSSQELLLSLSQKDENGRNETINELVRRVREGDARIVRMGKEIQHQQGSDSQIAGVLVGGWQLGLASQSDEMLGGVVRGSSSVEGRPVSERSDTSSAQYAIISWAKATGHYFDEEQVKESSLDKDVWKERTESRVYRTADGKKVIKFANTYSYYQNPLLKRMDGIALHNAAGFEPITVLGYTEDSKGRLLTVVEQDYVDGVTIEDVFDDEPLIRINNYLDSFIEEGLGLQRHIDKNGTLCHIKDGLIYKDIHSENVLLDRKGKHHVIDCYVSMAEDDKKERTGDFVIEDDTQERFSIRTKEAPKKTGTGYKVFVLKDGELYPPMVANPNGEGTPVGVWLDADAAPVAGTSKTGRPQVKAGGKGTQGGSGQLAYRPGWHLGTIPYALQFGRKDANGERTLFPNNFVWAEVEYADDVDYQDEARQEGVNANGKYQHSLAGLKHVPTDGSYKYRTNPDPRTDEWVITGAMRVKKILTRAEVDELVRKAGREPQQIQDGDIVTDDVVKELNDEIKATMEADEMGLLYRDDDAWVDDIAKDAYEKAVAQDGVKLKEAWQDSMVSLKLIQNAIARETGNVAAGAEDAYNYENRMHGRAKNMTEQYDWKFYRPMLKSFADFCKKHGYTQEQGIEYLISKSGLERNMYYALQSALKEKVTEDAKKQREAVKDEYAKRRISEDDYKNRMAEIDEYEMDGVDNAINDIKEKFLWKKAQEDYDNGSIDFGEMLRRREMVIGSVVPKYAEYAHDYSGLTETFAKSMYDSAQRIKKEAQRAIDPKERRMLWHDYDQAMKEAYDIAREWALDAVFSGEDGDFKEDSNKLWATINAATEETLKHNYESGLMDRKTYNKVRAMFDYYIPLRGWDEDKAADVYTYMGKDNVFSPAVKKTWGRTSKAENPLAYIGNIAVSTIIAGHRNLMKQHFLNYVMNNPTSLVSISESWYENIGSDENPVWILRTADTAGKSGDELALIVNDFNEEMRQKQRDGKAMPVRGRLRLDVHATSGQKNEHVVEVQRAGRTYQLYINGNPKAAQALNGTAARAVSRISDTWLGQKVTRLNRNMAMFFTSKNPAFVVSNLSRDLNMAGASVAINEGPKYNARFIANVIKVLTPRLGESSKWVPASKQPTGLMPSLMRKWKKGTLDESNETERLFKEFMDEGGETGFVNMLSIDSFKEKMQKEIREMNGSSMIGAKGAKETSVHKGLRLLGDTFEFYNRCAEDATRFIVYMTSRQMGKTLEESIADAKNVTLNFNRKGTGALGNAEVRDLFIFVNPAIQALANMYRMAKGHPLKFGGVTAAFVAGGALMPIINQWLINMFGDDDDKDSYWNLPPWVRKNNFVFWVPGTKNFVTIPLSQEFRVFYGIGEMVSSLAMEHPVNSWGLELFSSVADLVPINPTGNGGNLLVDFAPTMVQPLMQIGENVDFTGKPIWRDNQGNKYDPMFAKAYVSTPKWMTKISEGINYATGGDQDSRGWLERTKAGEYLNNPAVWNHLMQGYFGGMYNTIAKTFDVTATAASGEMPKIYQTPIINRFLNRPVERDNAGVLGEEYWNLVNEMEETQHIIQAKRKRAADGDEDAKLQAEELQESNDGKRADVIRHYKSIIDDLRKGERASSDKKEKQEFKRSMSLYKQQMLEELQAIDAGADPLEAALQQFDKATKLEERKKLQTRINRLTADTNRTKGSDEDVKKAKRYLDGEVDEQGKPADNYLKLATSEDIKADARIKAAKARIKVYADKLKELESSGKGDEVNAYRQANAPWLTADAIIKNQSRLMSQNKKLLGKGHDASVMKLIANNRNAMLKAIDELPLK